MKIFFPVTVLLILTLALSAEEQQRSISVTGEACVRVTPTAMKITFGMETRDENIQMAHALNITLYKRFLQVCEDASIDMGHIQTNRIQMEPNYDNYRDLIVDHYRAYRTVIVTVTDLSQLEIFLLDALTAGVTHIHDISAIPPDLRKNKDAARAAAIVAAQEKATALATALHMEIGAPIQINEQQQHWSYASGWNNHRSYNQNTMIQGNTQTPSHDLAIGQIGINATIHVTFSLHPSPKKE